MSILFSDFHEALRSGDGPLLATCLAPINSLSDPKRLWLFSQLSNYQTIEADIRYHIVQDRHAVKLPKSEANQWIQIFVSLWKCIKELANIEAGQGAGDWISAFKAYKEVCISLYKGYQSHGFPAWTIPCMSTAGKYLRMLAIKADEEAANATNTNGFANGFSDDVSDTSEKNDKLTDAARTIQQMLGVCRQDDSDISESRKWGAISLANLLFKTYFKLNNLVLTKYVISMLESPGVNLPPLVAFPKAQQCTYSYYRGVLDFLKENYAAAETHLDRALAVCHRSATKNREQILSYLVPAHILNSKQLPSKALLSQIPSLEALFLPLCTAIKSGNLSAFDRALAAAETELVNRRIYLTLERSRDLCMRNLFRKVFINAGSEEIKDASGNVTQTRRTRLRIAEFEVGVKVACKDPVEPIVIDRDQVECFLANMIYKGYVKGYIAREQRMVVLSKKGDAFPGTGV